jgi:N-dimethylarginine dimethylaminohydrolase
MHRPAHEDRPTEPAFVRAPADAPTPARRIGVGSETGRLRSVVIGYPDSFEMPEPINQKHEIFHRDHPERPTRASLAPEFAGFRAALEDRGIEVLQPGPVDGVPDQLTPRDIGFVIGDTFVVASMATACRRNEWKGITHVLDSIPAAQQLVVPPDCVVEGGDVILDRGVLYIGLSERTTPEGASFIAERFGDRYRVELVSLKELHHDEDVLHMDCTFLPVGSRHALIYPDGFHDIPDSIRNDYEWIEVDRDEQFELATNVLSLSPTTVISRDGATRINGILRSIGLDVIELRFDETPKSGGSFRCASLPLLRDDDAG